MHWSDEIAQKLIEMGSPPVIETGTSISGIPHIGNASDVIRGDSVRRSLKAKGVDANLIWVSDDMDPFRKTPQGMESLVEYLGFPVDDIPDPHGCHASFVEHFATPFIDDLKSFGVEPNVHSATKLYKSGALNDEIKVAFEKREEITEILNRFRRQPLPKDYVPWTPICEKCGRISTTEVTELEDTMISYECSHKEISGGQAMGCGYNGVQDALKGYGKLPWRVEWAAKWSHFKVTCEPFGKDHASAGGSYETSRIISEDIFGWRAPEPVIYEFFTLNGAKISSSKGNVITLSEWAKISEPEVLRYFMFKKLNKARDINLKMLPNLVDEYDKMERIHFGAEQGDDESMRMYQLAQKQEPKYLNIPYTYCAVLSQVASEDEYCARARWSGYKGFDSLRLSKRVKCAGKWVKEYGPEYLKFELRTTDDARIHYSKLDPKIKTCLKHLADALDESLDASQYHKRIYEIARGNMVAPPELFTAIYQTLIGKEKGPKAASFLQTLGKKHLIEIFRE
jgi:lysyl-tRNA synthetase, class I